MRLLVIEDYVPLREALARGLRDAGYAVDATGSGVDGLWYAENHPYDAIILDLMLPGIDGFAILGRLRAAGNGTRVLVLTARDAVADLEPVAARSRKLDLEDVLAVIALGLARRDRYLGECLVDAGDHRPWAPAGIVGAYGCSEHEERDEEDAVHGAMVAAGDEATMNPHRGRGPRWAVTHSAIATIAAGRRSRSASARAPSCNTRSPSR